MQAAVRWMTTVYIARTDINLKCALYRANVEVELPEMRRLPRVFHQMHGYRASDEVAEGT